MKVNKKKIRIVRIADHGRNHEMYCDKVLLLRNARKAGDTEVVNHYVLGVLKRMQGSDFEFEIIED